jgi:hypothetical protein
MLHGEKTPVADTGVIVNAGPEPLTDTHPSDVTVKGPVVLTPVTAIV